MLKRAIRPLIVIAAMVALAATTAATTACEPQAGDPLADGMLFDASSPWNQALPASPSIDPNSSSMVSSMVSDARTSGSPLTWTSWSVPLYYADASTPKVTVHFDRFSFGGYHSLQGVPLPASATQADGGDGHLTVFNTADGCMYDLFEAHKTNGVWYAGWANRQYEHDDGIYDKGASGRGSGFANLAGLIFPSEINGSGVIDHPLLFSTGVNRRETNSSGQTLVRPPATETDGARIGTQYIPEGARVQLNPNFNLSGYPTWLQKIGNALKTYGGINGDNSGGGFNLYALDTSAPGSYQAGTGYPWGSTSYPTIPLAFIQNLRVLTLNPAVVQDVQPLAHPCGAYSTAA